MNFTEKVINFLVFVYKKSEITRDDQPFYDNIRFYFMTNYLKKNDLIKVNGMNEKRQQVWVLTPKGKRVAEHLLKILQIMEREEQNES